jgi:hypothetical protein
MKSQFKNRIAVSALIAKKAMLRGASSRFSVPQLIHVVGSYRRRRFLSQVPWSIGSFCVSTE